VAGLTARRRQLHTEQHNGRVRFFIAAIIGDRDAEIRRAARIVDIAALLLKETGQVEP